MIGKLLEKFYADTTMHAATHGATSQALPGALP
jgi:hypothetical protein